MSAARVTVRVPATTANLGPGFDCLALALDWWNEATFELVGEDISVLVTGEGAGRLPRDEHNLMAQAFFFFHRAFGLTLPRGLRIHCNNQVPLGSGLGSSASAAVAGLLAANALSGRGVAVSELLRLADALEGHPDNAAAALLGGLVIIARQEEGLLTRRYDLDALSAAVVLPDFNLPTRTARAALPPQVSMQDAVFNLGRTALVVDALRSGDLHLLGQVMDDRLHQPYRLKLIPGAESALAAARQAGAAAAAISGAGPSLIAFLQRTEDAGAVNAAMQAELRKAGLSSRPFALRTTNAAATCTR